MELCCLQAEVLISELHRTGGIGLELGSNHTWQSGQDLTPKLLRLLCFSNFLFLLTFEEETKVIINRAKI